MAIFHGDKYVGQYALSPPPYTSISVDGSLVKVKSGDTRTALSLDFSRGPPSRILINGEETALFR